MSDKTNDTKSEECNFDWLLVRNEEKRAARAALMPDQEAAVSALNEAFERLKDLGWREGVYAPKNGTVFETLEAGSTGVHHCHYSGKWPDGYWMTACDRDLYPSSSAPLLYRLFPADEAARKARMAAVFAEAETGGDP